MKLFRRTRFFPNTDYPDLNMTVPHLTPSPERRGSISSTTAKGPKFVKQRETLPQQGTVLSLPPSLL